MISRRDYLKLSALLGATSLCPATLLAQENQTAILRTIPGTSEQLPVVGLGSSATFRRLAQSGDTDALKEVMRTLLENGGRVFDTAPGYGDSEEVAGEIIQDLDAEEKVFWATKVNAMPRGGDSADANDARAQIERSFSHIGKDPIDLMQVHNLADIPTQLGILKELKEDGRIRYIGTTITGEERYPDLARVMLDEPLDFIGIDYAVDNRSAAEQIFPIAQDRGIGVLVYLPFGRTRLWNRVGDRPVPEWAAEIGVESWAQFFIKFAAAHPAVTVVTPATSKPHHMLDNLGAGRGELPDTELQARMARFVDELPTA